MVTSSPSVHAASTQDLANEVLPLALSHLDATLNKAQISLALFESHRDNGYRAKGFALVSSKRAKSTERVDGQGGERE